MSDLIRRSVSRLLGGFWVVGGSGVGFEFEVQLMAGKVFWRETWSWCFDGWGVVGCVRNGGDGSEMK